VRCGKPVVHTEDDKRPLCDKHIEVEAMENMLTDMVEGRLRPKE
jgi:hypothetical protein